MPTTPRQVRGRGSRSSLCDSHTGRRTAACCHRATSSVQFPRPARWVPHHQFTRASVNNPREWCLFRCWRQNSRRKTLGALTATCRPRECRRLVRAVCASSRVWTAGSGGQRPPFVLLVQGGLYARFEHAGVLAEVAKLPEHVGRSLATELRILFGQVCAPARHVILRRGFRTGRRSRKPRLSYQTLPTLLKCDDGVTFEERAAPAFCHDAIVSEQQRAGRELRHWPGACPG